jgi:hypothetical protein
VVLPADHPATIATGDHLEVHGDRVTLVQPRAARPRASGIQVAWSGSRLVRDPGRPPDEAQR